MHLYVDFDDCLCETARSFSQLVMEMFGRNVPYENIRTFDLEKSFGLNKVQFKEFMIRAHTPEVLLSYKETPGASSVINEWINCGHKVSVITGRPLSAYEASRKWLDMHGLQKAALYCFDKYGRHSFTGNSDFSLTLEGYCKMKFDFAVEDSTKAFKFFDHLPDLQVLVFDRPWNRDCEFPDGNYTRCFDWKSIRRKLF